jgi:ATP-binding cassette subfamily B protein
MGSGRRGVKLLARDLSHLHVSPQLLRAALCRDLEAPIREELAELMAPFSPARRERAMAGVLGRALAGTRVRGIWSLRVATSAPLTTQLRQLGVFRTTLALFLAHVAYTVMFLSSWRVLGEAVLNGRMDVAWVFGWALILFSTVPLRVLSTWLTSVLVLRLSAYLKVRLFHGALRLAPDELRMGGVGRVLGHVLESSALENLAIPGAVQAGLGVIDLVFALLVLAHGASPLLLVLAITLVFLALVVSSVLYLRRRLRWAEARVHLTTDLVERMVGHRTRVTQVTPDHWHDGEDEVLEGYLERSRPLDRTQAILSAIGRAAPVLGLVALAPSIISAKHPAMSMAITLGGLLLTGRALRRFSHGAVWVTSAASSWKQVSFLFRAASREDPESTPAGVALTSRRDAERERSSEADEAARRTVLAAHKITFRYRPQGRSVLEEAALSVKHGERILVDGRSGSGKSTLVSILLGIRSPQSGTVLLDGLDRATLGSDGWRRLAGAPQFHENHIFNGSLAFNLLMGRVWPPSPELMKEAHAVCRELGLGPLLRRMPSGLAQQVGEAGWQLSHGERSRVFVARALLQDADLVILDESLAALDPDSVRMAMECVFRRARSLILIAHP